METSIGIVKKSQYRTTEWSGGTTTELLIYPSGSSYSERSFKWRLSSAKVEASESVFTSLPGITRYIMVTEGQLILEHENHYKKALDTFQQDCFMGDWETVSRGKATDFNLMLAQGFSGSLEVCFLKAGEQIHISLGKEKKATNVFYALNGDLLVEVDKNRFDIEEKDLFHITQSPDDESVMLRLTNTSKDEAAVIRAEIMEKA